MSDTADADLTADADADLSISEYEHGHAVALDDARRWPDATPAELARLAAIEHHPFAPRWRHRTGHRLTAAQITEARTPFAPGEWLSDHLDVARGLPAYRGSIRPLTTLDDFPFVSRDDLVNDISLFMPCDADLSRLVTGTSSGSTGAALQLPDDIVDTARDFWHSHEQLAAHGVTWEPDPTRLAVAHLVRQRQAFTYTSLVPGFGGSVMARLNLDAGEWAPDAQRAFFADVTPQLYTGSPAALEALLGPTLRDVVQPLGIISGATHLSDGLRAALEVAFDCPVIENYGLHETRVVATRSDAGPWRVLRERRIHVELIDPRGAPVAEGERGEIVVTSGVNPLLPLVRYRTGDFARAETRDGELWLHDLEGREDTRFRAADGREVPCVDLTQYLQFERAYAWAVEQHPDATVTARIVGGDAGAIEARLHALLGVPVTVQQFATIAELGDGKPRRYLAYLHATEDLS